MCDNANTQASYDKIKCLDQHGQYGLIPALCKHMCRTSWYCAEGFYMPDALLTNQQCQSSKGVALVNRLYIN